MYVSLGMKPTSMGYVDFDYSIIISICMSDCYPAYGA